MSSSGRYPWSSSNLDLDHGAVDVTADERNVAVDETKITASNASILLRFEMDRDAEDIPITEGRNDASISPTKVTTSNASPRLSTLREVEMDRDAEESSIPDGRDDFLLSHDKYTTSNDESIEFSMLNKLELDRSTEDMSIVDVRDDTSLSPTKFTTPNASTGQSMLRQLGMDKDVRNLTFNDDLDDLSLPPTKITNSNPSTGNSILRQLETDRDRDTGNIVIADGRNNMNHRPLSPTFIMQKGVLQIVNKTKELIDVDSMTAQSTKVELNIAKDTDSLIKPRWKNWFSNIEEHTGTKPNTVQSTNTEWTTTEEPDSISNNFLPKSMLKSYANPKSVGIEKLLTPINIPIKLPSNLSKFTNTIPIGSKSHKTVSKNFLDDIVETNSYIGENGNSSAGKSMGSSVGESTAGESQTLNDDSVYELTPLRQLEKRFMRLLVKRKWNEIEKFFDMNPFDAEAIASTKPLFCGDDYPLHLVCDINVRLKERMGLLKEWENEIQREKDKKNAKYERTRRRINGENVATVYDSDEWTSDEDSDISDDSNLEKSTPKARKSYANQNEVILPPTSLILTMIKIYPEAIRCKGWNGKLPLHHVVHYNYPLIVIKAMILAYPEAMDIKDKSKESPRMIITARMNDSEGKWDSGIDLSSSKTRSIEEVVEVCLATDIDGNGTEVDICHSKYPSSKYDPGINAFLACPITCWNEHSQSLGLQDSIDKKINAMQEEVDILKDELVDIYEEEAYIDGALDDLSKCVGNFLVSTIESAQIVERVQILQMTLGPEFDKISTSLEKAIEVWDKNMYNQAGEDRKYIAAFNEDICELYEKVTSDMTAMKQEMVSLRYN